MFFIKVALWKALVYEYRARRHGRSLMGEEGFHLESGCLLVPFWQECKRHQGCCQKQTINQDVKIQEINQGRSSMNFGQLAKVAMA
jgi:hypothetical protein